MKYREEIDEFITAREEETARFMKLSVEAAEKGMPISTDLGMKLLDICWSEHTEVALFLAAHPDLEEGMEENLRKISKSYMNMVGAIRKKAAL